MCEFLVRTVSKPLSGNGALDCQRTQRGDVIVVVEDGHDWAARELDNPEWQILKVPGMSVDEGSAWASPEPSDGVRRWFWKRLSGLLLASLPLGAATSFAGGSRIVSSYTMDTLTVRALKYQKAPFPDTIVLGSNLSPRVIDVQPDFTIAAHAD